MIYHICQSYLQQGAYGYFGSTTIAYGPATGNGAADLICQYFLLNVLEGASIGRAMLMACQQFVNQAGQMDAIDLKTLSQFYLLGDPSVHPIATPSATSLPKGIAAENLEFFSRAERREKMKTMRAFLTDTKPTASKQVPTGKLSSQAKKALSNIVEKAGFSKKQVFTAFAVKKAHVPKSQNIKDAKTSMRYLITVGVPKQKKELKNVKQGVAVVAKEIGGRIVSYRICHQR